MNTTHPNAQHLARLYENFQAGKIADVLAMVADQCTFQLAGRSKLAGKYDKATFASKFLTTMGELSGGSFQMEVHDILASDRHGLVLATDKLMRGGKPVEYRTVHVWRFENGKPVAWYEYPRDLYAYDAIWS